MNPDAYVEMDEIEARHWWFVARRAILSTYIESLNLPENSNILEVGCGTGGNLKMLSRFGKVSALEMDDDARKMANVKTNYLLDIKAGSCPNEIPFPKKHFDLICLFDVLEHIDEDTETLISLRSHLNSNGRLLMTVPAYQWLWSYHDEYLHHKRRYSAVCLRELAKQAQYFPEKISYFNTLLFPLVALVRIKEKLFNFNQSGNTPVPPAPINKLFEYVFSSERFLLKRLNLPFGVSLVLILKP